MLDDLMRIAEPEEIQHELDALRMRRALLKDALALAKRAKTIPRSVALPPGSPSGIGLLIVPSANYVTPSREQLDALKEALRIGAFERAKQILAEFGAVDIEIVLAKEGK